MHRQVDVNRYRELLTVRAQVQFDIAKRRMELDMESAQRQMELDIEIRVWEKQAELLGAGAELTEAAASLTSKRSELTAFVEKNLDVLCEDDLIFLMEPMRPGREVIKHVDLSRTTIDRAAEHGPLVRKKVGREWFYDTLSVIKYKLSRDD
ncbi:MAG: hypothetical protein AAFU85_02190 [Planctomycetota bacterium]